MRQLGTASTHQWPKGQVQCSWHVVEAFQWNSSPLGTVHTVSHFCHGWLTWLWCYDVWQRLWGCCLGYKVTPAPETPSNHPGENSRPCGPALDSEKIPHQAWTMAGEPLHMVFNYHAVDSSPWLDLMKIYFPVHFCRGCWPPLEQISTPIKKWSEEANHIVRFFLL